MNGTRIPDAFYCRGILGSRGNPVRDVGDASFQKVLKVG